MTTSPYQHDDYLRAAMEMINDMECSLRRSFTCEAEFRAYARAHLGRWLYPRAIRLPEGM